MSDKIKTISREAGNTSKGFTLQKLRTISLLLDELAKGSESDFVAAIEYSGDVYVADKQYIYIEENKDYDSSNFSFASSAIKNTMVYFLDHWLANSRDKKIKFGIYATNKIAKEINSGRVQKLGIELPEEKIIESLYRGDYSNPLTLKAVKALILDEYKRQYEKNKFVTVEKSNFPVLEAFNDEDWKIFFSSIQWVFSTTSSEELEKEVFDKIITSGLIESPNLIYKAPLIRAELFYQLEIRQTKKNLEDRLLSRTAVENIFYKAVFQQIDEESYKYLSIDYSEIAANTKKYLKELIDLKYFAISGIRKSPGLLHREVMLLDDSIKITASDAENYDGIKSQSVKGFFSNLIQTNKPVFLFGELGTGKSSIVANYLLELIEEQHEIIPLFIPSNYFEQDNALNIEGLKKTINAYVNKELRIKEGIFDLDTVFKTKKECVLVVDGLDELELKTSRQLVILLKSLKLENEFLQIIATGRPIELEGVVPSGWHNLGIVPLEENDISRVLYTEALNRGFSVAQSEQDCKNRLSFLKGRPELYAISTTPLIICSIRDSLDAGISDKTLGAILYDTLKKKLKWNSADGKIDEYSDFAAAYPNSLTKEPLLANLAWKILSSPRKALMEDQLETVIFSSVAEGANKPKIAAQAVKFFKNNFLEKSTGESFAFISAPLLECAAGLYLVEKLKEEAFSPDMAAYWRPVSFALAIARQKGMAGELEKRAADLLGENLTWPRNFVLQGAMLAAEFKSENLCAAYFEMLDSMQYRPIRIEYDNDTASTSAYASCMILAKEKGFGWFWDNYLNLRNPLMHYEGKLASDILSQYLVLQNYEIKDSEKVMLESLIMPNLTFPSSFCYELLPVIAMITDKEITAKQRLQLLCGNLSKPALGAKARAILIEEFKSSKAQVLDALETVSNRQADNDSKPAELWLELNTDRKITKGIIGVLLKGINFENFNDFKKKISAFIKEEDFVAFLKYCVLSENEFTDAAALFLFLNGEKDFKLIGVSLLRSIDWLDVKNYAVVQKIEQLVKIQEISTLSSIIHQVPVDNHLGIPPAFWRVFLAALQQSETDHEGQFRKAVKHMSLLTLTRYPEIRIAFSHLLNAKNIYQEVLREGILGLDSKVRYLSAAILLTTNPGDEFEALEAILYGIGNKSDMSEWERFCLGLHYSGAVLKKLHQQADSFLGIARIFVLLLLKRNNVQLTAGQMDNLTQGLLLEGYFLDIQGSGVKTKYNIILSRPEYVRALVGFMDSENNLLAQRSADMLYQYHLSKVDDSKKAKIYMLYCEKYERAFFEFTVDSEVDLLDDRIVEQMQKDADEYKAKHAKEPLLWLFCKALKTNAGFEEVMKTLLKKERLSINNEWDSTYEWLLNLERRFPDIKSGISFAVGELMQIPAIIEADTDNFAWLKLMEHEFNPGSDTDPDKLAELLPNRAEELYIALYTRDAYKKNLKDVIPVEPAYYRVFANNRSEYVEEISENDMERYLFSAEQIPAELGSKILNVLLFGNFSGEELGKIENKGELGSYCATVIKFCRGVNVNAALFSRSFDIGGFSRSQRDLSTYHKTILYGIYKVLLSKEEFEQNLIIGIEAELENENSENYTVHFQQLLELGYRFKKEQVVRLFAFLDDKPYYFKPGLVFGISRYFASQLNLEDKDYYIENFKKFLSSNRGQFSKYDMDPQVNIVSWVLSLVVLFLEEKVSEEAKFGFLLGLQSCFLEKNSLQRYAFEKPDYFFQAGSLLRVSGILLEKIDPALISEIIHYGKHSNIAEVRATCHALSALSGGEHL
ncbi:hypothetical protein ASE21_14870 [Flavobacterium sp. Root901]|uniref:NACHT domain-containing protein n=1 Tax=Flavobacterium sp. Root901 TaxID=1736605 RepID=UPI00071122E0|nr:hypothetical protein [Flavobacterium sp. Root901]KRD09127.1 hypothetical protein ASE21_14870 [Flavobacterium sp. Root901]